MAGYDIEFTHKAARQFAKLTPDVQRRLRPRIDALKDDPRPSGSEQLEGFKNTRRIRVGDYRVLYQIEDEGLLVLVIRLGHRRDIYRRSR